MAHTPKSEGGRMNHADAFSRSFSPFRSRFYSQGKNGLFTDWIPNDSYLTDGRIEEAVIGKLVLAYLSTASPKAIGIDIDDHRGRGDKYLASQYGKVCGRFGARPSFLVSSPRGLHAWYFLISPYPFRFLEDQAKERINGLQDVEIKPTPTVGLRIPEEQRILSPDTMLPVLEDFGVAVTKAMDNNTYHAAELFGVGIMPEAMRISLRLSLRERKGRISYTSIARVEDEVRPIIPGTTNDALCRLIPVYRGAGLSEEEAAARFMALLAPVYDGELKNWKRLHTRVKAFYKQPAVYYERPRETTENLFSEIIADNVADLWNEEMRKGRGEYHVETRKAGIKRLVTGIVNWTDYISWVMQNPREREAWNYLYPYFKKNMAERYYPLPKSILYRHDTNYSRILPFLHACGFLEAAPYPYVPGAGICRYYRVETMRFS